MGQGQAKPAPPPPLEPPPPPFEPDGLVPRCPAARNACNRKRVRRLIKTGRLGPCWLPLEVGAEAAECPVCMEEYRRVNKTACCGQDICTECFINIVAPTCGVGARCPYCQALALQVYLPPPQQVEQTEAEAQQAEARAEAQEGAAEEVPAPAGVQAAATSRSSSTASSGLGLSELGDEVLEGMAAAPSSGVAGCACLAAAPSAAAAAVALAASASNWRICSGSNGASSSGGLESAFRACSLALAEAAAAASRQEGPAVVAMVLPQPASSGSLPPTAAAEPAAGSSASQGAAVEQPAAPSEPLAPGPALVLNPDGTEQLVLLRSGAEAEAAEAPGGGSGQEGAGAGLASYRAPPSAEDERMVAAIAAADAALRARQAPAPVPAPVATAAAAAQPGNDDWLQRLQAADAALQGAVARQDQQVFGAGQGGRQP